MEPGETDGGPVLDGLIADIARAVGFLSRLPVPERYFSDDAGSAEQMIRAFAIAGAVVMLPSAAVLFAVLAAGAEPYLAAAAAVTVGIFVTGALHEDGLADCADGLMGGRSRENSLEIMHDSRVGTYGALALILSVALRIASLAAIASLISPLSAAAIVIAVGALSRVAMVWHWSRLPPARPDGLAVRTGKPSSESLRFLLLTGGGGGLVIAWIAGGFGTVPILGLAFLASVPVFTRFVRRVIQGHTGDTIGASQQLVEIASLFGLAVYL